jgi:hypothetical protein
MNRSAQVGRWREAGSHSPSIHASQKETEDTPFRSNVAMTASVLYSLNTVLTNRVVTLRGTKCKTDKGGEEAAERIEGNEWKPS